MAIPLESALRIEQSSTLRDEQSWEWSVWIAGPDDELQQVKSVTYRLHPTFPNPVQTVHDLPSKFKLTAVGWGEFTIGADAVLQDGRTVHMERWIELRDSMGRRQTDPRRAGDRRPSVFVSHSLVDSEFVRELSDALGQQGVDVSTADSIDDVANSMASAVHDHVKTSDMLVAVFSDPPSPWVEQEARAALAARRSVLPVVLDRAQVAEPFSNLVRFELDKQRNVKVLADRIAAAVKDIKVPDESSA
jgi:hypothetical protein